MVAELLLTFTAGLFAGGGLSKLLRKPHSKPIIHIRGKHPWTYKLRCEYSDSMFGWTHAAEYLDQDTRAWCGKHLPPGTKYAERAALDATNNDAYCHAHGMECPKPWSII